MEGQGQRVLGLRRARAIGRSTGVMAVLMLVAAGCWLPPSAPNPALFSPHLTREPYLTDAVGLHVIVNWATDQTGSTGSVQWGAFDEAGPCLHQPDQQ